MASEKVRLRIGSLARAVLVTGQAYQDPKDALNEFVSNAADEYALAGGRGERIRIRLRRRGRYPTVAIDDTGRGMSPERLKAVAQNLFKSEKAGDDTTLGDKAIGLLAFQQLGGRCEIVSRAAESPETWTLKLERGKATALLTKERRRARSEPGTTIFLSDLDPDVLRTITQRKVVDYLRRRRGAALGRGDYEIEVQEGTIVELVTPERPEGLKVHLASQRTLWGTVEFVVYVTPRDGTKREVSVVGRAGTTVLDDIAELEEFDHEPWNLSQLSGQIIFSALQQSAGRRAILRDRDAFPIFLDTVTAVEPVLRRHIDKVNREIDTATVDRLSVTLRKVFGQVLRELADLDNPMRSPTGAEEGEGAVMVAETSNGDRPSSEDDTPTFESLAPETERNSPEPRPAAADRSGRSRLPSVAPDPEPGEARSRFDTEAAVVYYNEQHGDYLMVKDTEPLLLDYLATLVAKEYVVYNNPRAKAEEVSEELVRVLVRVRRLLPRRR